MFTMKGENKNQFENAKTFVILYGKTTKRQSFSRAKESFYHQHTHSCSDSFQNVYLIFTLAFKSKLTFVTNASRATLICVKLFPFGTTRVVLETK